MSHSALSIGIIGLPNVGKSTLFNALLQRQEALVANYPFATIEPNVGIVDVPDQNLYRLQDLFKSPSVVPATVKFYDIAGLVEGAHKGEGLGNQFLSHIREVDAIVHLVRDFSDENVIRAGATDPQHDRLVIETELALADIQTIDNRIAKLRRQPLLLSALEEIKSRLSQMQRIDVSSYPEEIAQEIRQLNLMTMKPVLLVKNVDEKSINRQDEQYICLCAKIEFELASFDKEEKVAYLESLGLKESGLDRLIRRSYEILGLQTFYTAGEKEVRAWTIKKGSTAPQAAGVIHTDFERGFIKAEVVHIEDLLRLGGWVKAREAGKVRLEGKEYVMQSNDVVIFKFNV